MIGYDLKMILRKVQNDLFFSGITVFGLVIGMTSFLILFLYVANEKSYDKHFAGYQNIYRVVSIPGGTGDPWARSLGIVSEAVKNIPEVELSTRFSHCQVGNIKIGKDAFPQNDIMSVDEGFTQMFEVKCLVGDMADINKPNVAFMSEHFAQKYFKEENPIGKFIDVQALQYYRDLGEYEIRGVVKNTHPKTHFNYEILLSQKGSLGERYTSVSSSKVQWLYSYVSLKSGSSPQKVTDEIRAFYDASELKQILGPKDYNFSLTPLKDIHLKSDFRFELKGSLSKINIGLFVMV